MRLNKNTHSLAVAIINLQKEINVGGIVRTANAAGLSEVIIVGRKKWNKTAATRAQRHINIRRVETTDDFLDYCKEEKYAIISVEIDKKARNIFEYEYPKNTILVIGNEGTGVPQKILNASEDIVCIPQYGTVECLNTATAAGIAIYDWIRKNSNKKPKNVRLGKYVSMGR